MNWRAVVLGVAVQAGALAAGNFVALPAGMLWIGAVLLFCVGFAGGFVAGAAADGGWRVRTRHGATAGLLGGVAFLGTLWASAGYLIPRASRGAFWEINYFLTTSSVLPQQIVADYGEAVVLLVGALGALAYAVEGAVAGGAAPGDDITPSPEDVD